MSAPRLESIRLEYGCHSGRFEVSAEARPVVISGRNGSGKTTLLEAFLRGLYGFSRRKPEERRLLALRQPWSGRPVETEIRLRAADGARITVHRDFGSDQVVVRAEGDGTELFRGDGNPVGVRSESRRYQELLREWVGFATLEPYRGTAWVAQGELVDTKLDDELLRAAAGTHRRVEVALKQLQEAFEALTREPLELGGRRKNRARDLERRRAAVEQAGERLEAARAAREKRRPLLERAGEIRRGIDDLEAEIALLEAAYRPITERRTLLAEQGEVEAHLAAVSESLRWLQEASGELERSQKELAESEAGGRYPADVETRLGQAEILWDRLDSLAGGAGERAATRPAGDFPSSTAAAVAGLALFATGVLIAWLLSLPAGVAIAIAGIAGYAARFRIARAAPLSHGGGAARKDEAVTVRDRLKVIEDGIPGPPLTRDTLGEHRRRSRRQAEAREAAARAGERYAEAVRRPMSILERAPGPDEPGGDLLRELEDARETARTRLARAQLRLEEQPVVPHLPEGVEPTVPAVESAREDRRSRRDGLREELTRLDLELRDLDRASEDVFALERELSRLRSDTAETEAEVTVRRHAWELVRDAYEAFRSTDQVRLLSAINHRLQELSGGRLGPVETPGDLASARVAIGGRQAALDSPPLSFGEKHLALLAIRLGAADFLSGDGTRHPLLVDEPFTHLDEARAREVWDVLRKIAVDRQVIVTTQDRLVLEHLGITPDLDLAVRPAAGSAEADTDAREPEPQDGRRDDPAVIPGDNAAPDSDEAEVSHVQARLELG